METRNELSERELEAVTGGGTGAGMAAWAQRAYAERWGFVWGGSAPGAVDSAGLIFSFAGGPRNTEAMFAAATEKGPISTMPDVPGLGLYMFGHVGVYVGGGMCVDARTEDVGVALSPIDSCGWTMWFRIAGVEYES